MLTRLSLFAMISLLLSACAPAATPVATLAPQPTSAPVAAPTAGSVVGTFVPDVRPPASGGGVTPPTLAPKHAASQPDSIKPLQGWQQLGSIKVPAARSDHVLIATGSFNRLVLFGGRSAGAAFKDTWIYDLAANAWHQVTSSIAPDARYGAGAAYDAASQRVLIFGGQAGTKFFNDVWSFDVVSEQWGQIKTAGIAPAARSGTAAAIDPELHQLIISHGAAAAGLTDDTWTLDLGTKVWQNILPGTRPTARSQQAATFDELHHRFILFGGLDASNRILNEQWSLDPVLIVWRQFGTIAAGNPAPRSGTTLVYDPGTFIIYLFGGKTIGGVNNEVWSLDPGNHWLSISLGSGPAARSNHGAAWDSTNNRMLVFGGLDANNKPLNDLWAFTP